MIQTTEPPTLTLADGRSLDLVEPPRVESMTERVRSERAVVADLRWEQPHGDHVHRWVGDDPRKAKVSEARVGVVFVECDGTVCDGSCGGEGYETDAWLCAHDGSELDPGYVPDRVARDIGVAVSVTTRYWLSVFGESVSEIEGAQLIWADGRTIPLPTLHRGEMSWSSEDPAPAFHYVGETISFPPRDDR